MAVMAVAATVIAATANNSPQVSDEICVYSGHWFSSDRCSSVILTQDSDNEFR